LTLVIASYRLTINYLIPSVSSFICSVEGVADKEKDFINRMLSHNIPCLIRPVDPETYARRKPGEPRRLVWMKANGAVGKACDSIVVR